MVGYWKKIRVSIWENPEDYYECSLCGSKSPQNYPFCPYCGEKIINRELANDDLVVTNDLEFFDETYPNCTVQILENPKTGERSMGWWKNE